MCGFLFIPVYMIFHSLSNYNDKAGRKSHQLAFFLKYLFLGAVEPF